MNRIAIVGISGSGKSTLARRLGEKLHFPVFHLDKYYWNVGWKPRYATKEEFYTVVAQLAELDQWIIDGNHRNSIDIRLERADVIIFLDFPKLLGLWRACVRTLNRQQPFDKVEGLKDKVDWKHVKFCLTYPKHEMRARVLKYIDTKKVYIAKNRKEVEKVFDEITVLHKQ